MGLDMYLFSAPKNSIIVTNGGNKITQFLGEESAQEVAYWRKANQIHNWFVNNIQDGEDKCEYYIVSKEKIEELLEVCNEIIEIAILEDAQVVNGYTYKDGSMVPMMENGKVIKNAEEVAKILPSTSGFFFGKTDYDSYYYDNVKYTQKKLTKILEEFNFDENYLVYISSW